MEKVREDGYIAAIGSGVFGIFMILAGWNVGFSNLTGQGCTTIGIVFILISGGSFIKPESIGQIALRLLKNQQEALLKGGTSQRNNQPIHNEKIDGNVFNTVGSENTKIIYNDIKLNKTNHYDMKVEFSTVLSAGGLHLLAITGMNIGDMPITLSSWGFELPNGDYITEVPSFFPRPVTFPYKLPPGESVTVGMENAKVAQMLEEANYQNTIYLVGFFKDQINNKYKIISKPFNNY